MSGVKHLFQRIKRRILGAVLFWERALRHSMNAVRDICGVLRAVTFFASVACILLAMAYVGYDHEPDRLRHIMHYFRMIQGVFAVNILFNLLFNMKATLRNTRAVKWIVDLSMLLTLLPVLYPRPASPWIPWLETILYSNKFFLGILIAYAIVDISYGIMIIMGKRTNPSLILSLSFMFFILLGSFMLMMPRCTYHGIEYVDSLFLATSAVCITGLTSIDIPSTFTPLGLLVLAFLIQTGALGVMTFTSFFALFYSGNNSVYSQLVVKDMIYTKSINALIPTLLYIFLFTIAIEAAGAVFIWWSIRDVLDMSLEDQLIFSAFHSQSAFCNAGFSNLPDGMANPVLMNSNQSIYLVISVITLAGAIGFPILVNFRDVFLEYTRRLWCRIKGRERVGHPVHIYSLNTKVALYTTLIIFAVSVILFFTFEYDNSLAGFSLYDKIVQSIFNSTTPRSSGFVSVSPAGFLNVTLVFVLLLMWIGGASQSTAGGIKVNTFAAILINLKAIILGHNKVTAFHRTISTGSIRRANAVVTLSILSYFLIVVLLMMFEPGLSARSLVFEASSALFTVGSSFGITSLLCSASKILLITAMFLGRVGIISLLIGVTGNQHDKPVAFPTDNLIIN